MKNRVISDDLPNVKKKTETCSPPINIATGTVKVTGSLTLLLLSYYYSSNVPAEDSEDEKKTIIICLHCYQTELLLLIVSISCICDQ